MNVLKVCLIYFLSLKSNRIHEYLKRLSIFLFRYLRLTENNNKIDLFQTRHIPNDTVQKQLNDEHTFLLASIQKSGTMFTLSTLGNYFEQLLSNKPQKLSSLDCRKKYFPVNRYYFKQNELPKNLYAKELGYSNFYWAHIYPYSQDLHHYMGKLVLLYRNPLDTIISSYFYYEKNQNRTLRRSKAITFNQTLSYFSHEFGRCFSYTELLKKSKPNSCVITYESLIENPFNTYEKIIKFLGIEFNEQKMKQALEYSSFKATQESERSGNTVNKNQQGMHARSGKIGQWQDMFSKKDIKEVEKILSLYNISLDQFQLLPNKASK